MGASGTDKTDKVDVVVIGAGVVGLASARAILEQRPGASLVVVDKEPGLAAHQTGRNSGVIHSGIYYKPGSLKARTCAEGRAELLRFVRERGVAHEICGKVIVATRPDELPRLDALAERAEANGVPAERIGRARLRELEPHCEGIAALHVTSAGIVDFVGMCTAMAAELEAAGAELRLGRAVVGLVESAGRVRVETDGGALDAAAVVNCAGLHSDRVARLADGEVGGRKGVRIMPFRGEYYELVPGRRELCRNLIYPVPDPQFPFLGVHFTRMIGGEVHAGPNAVPAFAREGYSWREVDRRDALEILTAPSSWKLARRHWRTELGEVHRSVSKRAFVKALQALVPEVAAEDLVRSGSGVRAQAIAADGALLDDFSWRESERIVHVLNAPSPAATASLAIGRAVAERAVPKLS